MSIFGAQLRKTRKERGLTAAKIAQVCGTSRSYITLMENGKRLPGKKVLPKLAQALNIKTVVVLNWYLEDLRERLKNA